MSQANLISITSGEDYLFEITRTRYLDPFYPQLYASSPCPYDLGLATVISLTREKKSLVTEKWLPSAARRCPAIQFYSPKYFPRRIPYWHCMVSQLINVYKPDRHFTPLCLRSPCNRFLTFAIPTQIRTGRVSRSAGLRVFIGEDINIQGIASSEGTSVFHKTNSPTQLTGRNIKEEVDLEVVILGKTRSACFGDWKVPGGYTDFQTALNPRADGFQSPGGSGLGGACAVATYD
ncbi:hypothetical protein B0J13DRAFT_517325 [Dactylonectria estremocensis]|uniref:Uncharacterized protein n=1 Tax=Dactylonectria estremocensis TaxID=1079267 RepID=A0A9P9JHT8_9HYPO|nr:hypothetical protein B0J13DRAFT_517325 [Dactylonectria estremocensis]